MMRLQAAPPTSALSALAAHSPRSAGVAASAGIASSRATQRSSPPDPRAAMLFPLRLALQRDTYGRDDFSPNGRHSAIVNPGPRWVKLRRTQYEHMFSALPPVADILG